MKNPGSLLKLSRHIHSHPLPYSSHLDLLYLCMYYEAEQILVVCSVSNWKPETNNESISFSLVSEIYTEFGDGRILTGSSVNIELLKQSSL